MMVLGSRRANKRARPVRARPEPQRNVVARARLQVRTAGQMTRRSLVVVL